MIGETEAIVRAHHDHFADAVERHRRAHRRSHVLKTLGLAARFELLEEVVGALVEVVVRHELVFTVAQEFLPVSRVGTPTRESRLDGYIEPTPTGLSVPPNQ